MLAKHICALASSSSPSKTFKGLKRKWNEKSDAADQGQEENNQQLFEYGAYNLVFVYYIIHT